jgi:hypothetical protein
MALRSRNNQDLVQPDVGGELFSLAAPGVEVEDTLHGAVSPLHDHV